MSSPSQTNKSKAPPVAQTSPKAGATTKQQDPPKQEPATTDSQKHDQPHTNDVVGDANSSEKHEEAKKVEGEP